MAAGGSRQPPSRPSGGRLINALTGAHKTRVQKHSQWGAGGWSVLGTKNSPRGTPFGAFVSLCSTVYTKVRSPWTFLSELGLDFFPCAFSFWEETHKPSKKGP
jgi:hypothetical protein